MLTVNHKLTGPFAVNNFKDKRALADEVLVMPTLIQSTHLLSYLDPLKTRQILVYVKAIFESDTEEAGAPQLLFTAHYSGGPPLEWVCPNNEALVLPILTNVGGETLLYLVATSQSLLPGLVHLLVAV
jgi:hypothetical protein